MSNELGIYDLQIDTEKFYDNVMSRFQWGGVKENKDYYILRTTEIPAVIVECGFLSNYEEEKLLNDAEYQEKLAWAIYCGILDYFEKIDMM